MEIVVCIPENTLEEMLDKLQKNEINRQKNEKYTFPFQNQKMLASVDNSQKKSKKLKKSGKKDVENFREKSILFRYLTQNDAKTY